MEWYPVRADEAEHGNTDDKECVEPVDMLVPVPPCNGKLGDVWKATMLASLISLLVGEFKEIRTWFPRVDLLVGPYGDVIRGAIGESLSLHCDSRGDRRRGRRHLRDRVCLLNPRRCRLPLY